MKTKKYDWKLHNKTVKHPYTGSKAIDRSCRCHGSCDWCRDNRQYQSNKKLQEMKQKLDEFLEEDEEIRFYDEEFPTITINKEFPITFTDEISNHILEKGFD